VHIPVGELRAASRGALAPGESGKRPLHAQPAAGGPPLELGDPVLQVHRLNLEIEGEQANMLFDEPVELALESGFAAAIPRGLEFGDALLCREVPPIGSGKCNAVTCLPVRPRNHGWAHHCSHMYRSA
jgi:hypothetical protein